MKYRIIKHNRESKLIPISVRCRVAIFSLISESIPLWVSIKLSSWFLKNSFIKLTPRINESVDLEYSHALSNNEQHTHDYAYSVPYLTIQVPRN